jgi:hypothetical protein
MGKVGYHSSLSILLNLSYLLKCYLNVRQEMFKISELVKAKRMGKKDKSLKFLEDVKNTDSWSPTNIIIFFSQMRNI